MTGTTDAQGAILIGMALGVAIFLIAIAVMKLHNLAERRRYRTNIARLVMHLDGMSPEAILRV